MKYLTIQTVNKSGNALYINLSIPIRKLGWKHGDKLEVTIPDDHIAIKKIAK